MSEAMADRLTERMSLDAQQYVDEFFPAGPRSDEYRSDIATAFVEGGGAALRALIKELENGRINISVN